MTRTVFKDESTASSKNLSITKIASSQVSPKSFWAECGVTLVDFKLEFGKTVEGQIILADEISPDTCRLWDSKTHEKLDKDRFRRDMGGVEDAYAEIMKRLLSHDAD